jgi:hypothetical protein
VRFGLLLKIGESSTVPTWLCSLYRQQRRGFGTEENGMTDIQHITHEQPPSTTAVFDHGVASEIEIDGGGGGCFPFLIGIASAVALIIASVALIVVTISAKRV